MRARAEGDLGCPRVTHDWPKSDAGWSPTRAVIGGDPAQRARGRRAPHRVDDLGQPRRASPSALRTAGSQPRVGGPTSPVTAALEWSVTCARAREQSRDPGVDRGEAQVARRAPRPRSTSQRSFVADWLGASAQALALQDQAVDHRAQVLPAQRRPDRLAGRGVEDDGRRALVGTPTTSAPPASSSVRRASSSTASATSPRRRARPTPGAGVATARRRAWASRMTAVGTRRRPRCAPSVVPTSIAEGRSSRRPAERRGPPGLSMPSGSSAALSAASTSAASPRALAHEARAVAPDAVVVAERRARAASAACVAASQRVGSSRSASSSGRPANVK